MGERRGEGSRERENDGGGGGVGRERERLLLGDNMMELHTSKHFFWQINLWLSFNHGNTALVCQISDVQCSPSRCRILT